RLSDCFGRAKARRRCGPADLRSSRLVDRQEHGSQLGDAQLELSLDPLNERHRGRVAVGASAGDVQRGSPGLRIKPLQLERALLDSEDCQDVLPLVTDLMFDIGLWRAPVTAENAHERNLDGGAAYPPPALSSARRNSRAAATTLCLTDSR